MKKTDSLTRDLAGIPLINVLIMMKLIIFIILFSSVQCFAVKGFSQQKINLDIKNTAIEAILKHIETKTDYRFVYDERVSNSKHKLDLYVKDATIDYVMNRLLTGTGLSFKELGNGLVIVFGNAGVIPNAIPVTGRVTDNSGNPLSGVSIIEKGTNNGTTTNTNGIFSINIRSSASVLIVTHIGYGLQEIKVGNRTNLEIRLVSDVKADDGVVVIAYGSVRRQDVTGSVAEVNVEELNKAPVASFDQALAGRIAGVQASSAEDGQPGEGMNIIIRGTNSLTQNNSPLYIVDGFPMENPETASINPNDIESISVLKDASATAIYGSRAANGVIVIETKKGKIGKPIITISSSVGPQMTSKKMDMLSSYEFVKYQIERYGESGYARYAPADLDPSSPSYDPTGKTLESYKNIKGINWQDELFQTGLTQIHNLSLRGGTKETKYSISGSIYDQNAIIINTGYKRYQGRFSIDQIINNKLTVGLNANYSNQNAYGQILGRTSATSSTTISGYLLYSVWGYRPVTGKEGNDDFLLDDLLEDIVDEDVDDANSDFRINPLVSAKETLRERKTNNFTANAYATYNLTKNLVFKITGGLNSVMMRNNAFYNSKTVRGTPLRPNNINGVNGFIRDNETFEWLNENTLTYNKRFNRSHRLEVLGGMTHQSIRRTSDGFSAIQVPNEELGIYGLSQGLPLENYIGASKNTLQSFFTRINYNFKSKYLLTATMRADGSSKFAPGHRWGYFPSAAFAWRMADENFMKNISFVSDAKLRMSYGVTGNNRVSDFAYLASVEWNDLASYSFNNTRYFGLNMDQLSNPELKWESTSQFDIGYDLSLFNRRVNFIFDWYRKTTFDLLLNAQLPYTTGFSNAFKNIGKVRNEGLEFTLSTVNYTDKNFNWESSFNISFNKNRIMALNESQPNMLSRVRSFVTRMAEEPLYIAEVGKPAAMFYGLIWDGVYQYSDFDEPSPGVYVLKQYVPTNGDVRSVIQPGDIKYKDINGDGVVDANDKTVIGRGLPIHIGGFNNSFSYKGFDLNVFMQWSYGNDLMNANRLIFEGNITNVHHFNQYASWADRWTPENQSNNMFRVGGSGPQVMSSRTIEDGSYLRLKTVSLSYTFPKTILRKIKMNTLSLNVAAQNLLTWTKYSGMDPEVSVHNTVLTPGFDFSAYPHARTIVLGIKAGL